MLFRSAYARPWKNNIIRYNISENDGRTNGGGITLFKAPNTTMDSLKIYHNTIYLTPSPKNSFSTFAAFSIVDWDKGLNGVEVYNNIFQTISGVNLINIPFGYTSYFAGNLYWTGSDSFKIYYQDITYLNLSDWSSATGNEKLNGNSVGIYADPLLINIGKGSVVYPNPPEKLNGYTLRDNSPAINRGLDLNTLFGINTGNRDFFNNQAPYGLNPDIGAYESKNLSSVKETLSEQITTAYPNPVETVIFLDSPDLVKTGNIIIYSVLGTKVLETGYSEKVDVSSLSSGVYYLKTNDILFKFVKK